ncbi:hypothetical protein G3I40_04410 [Streptomyces sp. SID14478]|uniref:DUF6153 family protein n=1 Tax=Streptomyces sp. SID14478 TaxID=2706073 RepID=UPI0013DA3809|nr:DUF6153 family protein [Streptomyces sp. SID14478]NEB74477.1 hypothetical protein [Streptomyces sp. SID14478]
MTTSRGRTGRGQLLLFVALLFGIVGMHTLGHPTGHAMEHSAQHGGMTAHAAPAGLDGRIVGQAGHFVGQVVGQAGSHLVGQVVGDEHPSPGSPGDGGMDPLGVCLAVLGSFTLLLLLTAALLRPLLDTAAPGPVPRGMVCARRPHPPPPRARLSRLSVLRI